jgi:H+-transporting ATPase
MSILCSDKTGTLTLNEMMIREDILSFPAGGKRDTLLLYAALATRWREPAKDAIDTMVRRKICSIFE